MGIEEEMEDENFSGEDEENLEGDENQKKKSEEYSLQMKLKAAMHFNIGKMCENHGASKNISFDKKFIAALTQTTWHQCAIFGKDLELFAKHAKRSTINADDVKLLARRSPTVQVQMATLAERLSEKGPKKKASKKPKLSVESDIPIELDS